MPHAPGSGFFVDTKPYAVWEWDMPERNLEFIQGIQGDYFEYLAELHGANLDGESKQLAAIAIRTAYFHAVETFLTLAGASIQAPRAVPAWIHRCSTEVLRNIVTAIGKGQWTADNPFCISPISWNALAKLTICFGDVKGEELDELRSEFALLWSSLARDWLSELSIDEYNGLKHGFRVRPGGFTFSVGLEHKYGEPPPPDEFKSLGGSDFGTIFFRAQPVKGAPDNSKTHFRLQRQMVNWNPDALAKALVLISISISNLRAFLEVQNGVAPKDVKTYRPVSNDLFRSPWADPPGMISMSFDTTVREDNIERLPPDELAERIRQVFGCDKG